MLNGIQKKRGKPETEYTDTNPTGKLKGDKNKKQSLSVTIIDGQSKKKGGGGHTNQDFVTDKNAKAKVQDIAGGEWNSAN